MDHLNEGQGVRCGSAPVTNTLQTQRHPGIHYRARFSTTGAVKRRSTRRLSHLLEQSHGELLVRYAVFGCADVLPALRADVEVDPHEEILLTRGTKFVVMSGVVLCTQAVCVRLVCVITPLCWHSC